MNYYNDNDKHACAWLRELIKAKLIPEGEVDERSITEVRAEDLSKYDQCHWFAGIGGWAYALQLAGWPADRPVWTGSCPCQPFSAAGKGQEEDDPRHLWPAFRTLVAQCKPSAVLGEQVASEAGRAWLAGVRADLEAMGYAVGAADLCASCVGAPHIRQRLYWVANAQSERNDGRPEAKRETEPAGPMPTNRAIDPHEPGQHGGTPSGQQPLRDGDGKGVLGMGYRPSKGLQGEWSEYRPSGKGCEGFVGLATQDGVPQWNGPTVALWCEDGARRASAQPGAFPLASGLPARMGRLRGYGNSIVPQVAAEFIKAFVEVQL